MSDELNRFFLGGVFNNLKEEDLEKMNGVGNESDKVSVSVEEYNRLVANQAVNQIANRSKTQNQRYAQDVLSNTVTPFVNQSIPHQEQLNKDSNTTENRNTSQMSNDTMYVVSLKTLKETMLETVKELDDNNFTENYAKLTEQKVLYDATIKFVELLTNLEEKGFFIATYSKELVEL